MVLYVVCLLSLVGDRDFADVCFPELFVERFERELMAA